MDRYTAGHRRGVVCAPHFAAAEAGREVLAEGGNALEAMVAMAAMIAVAYPHMTILAATDSGSCTSRRGRCEP